ncbi:MAG: DUF4339 domain-containing protein [Planctomycetales bacterium]|nr:DUF4339 domain-containing protein [Planctomycetales bacterium]
MAEWFVQVDGKRYGPFDSAKLAKLAAVGKVKPNDLVKKGRDGQWKPAHRVRRLFDADAQANDGASRKAVRKSAPPTPSQRSAPRSAAHTNRPRSTSAGRSPAPAEPVFDLTEAFDAAPTASVPSPTAPAPALAKPTSRFTGLTDAVDKNATWAAKMAQLSWWIPLLLSIFSRMLRRARGDFDIPPAADYVFLGLYVLGCGLAMFALLSIPRQGAKRLLVPGGVGLLWNGLNVALLVFAIFFADALLEKLETLAAEQEAEFTRQQATGWSGQEGSASVEFGDEPYLKRRAEFTTALLERGPSPQEYDHESSPAGVDEVTYRSGDLTLKAWVNRSGTQAERNPALVYFHGGFAFGASDMEACQAFVDEGFIVMTPMLRGENGCPGNFELFLGEVDDAKAAVQWLAAQPDVDPDRIYTFGHSVGGGISAMLSLLDDVPIQHGGSSGGLYGLDLFDGWADDGYVPFDLDDPRERQLRVLLGNIRWMKHKHYAFLGNSDVFGPQEHLVRVENAQVAAATGNESLLEIRSVPGDHFSSFEPAVRMYLAMIRASEFERTSAQQHERWMREHNDPFDASSRRGEPVAPPSVPNPFRVGSADADETADTGTSGENPFEPATAGENPFDPPAGADNPFDPPEEATDPFEPAPESANPFE